MTIWKRVREERARCSRESRNCDREDQSRKRLLVVVPGGLVRYAVPVVGE